MKFSAVVFLAFFLSAYFGTPAVSPSFEKSHVVEINAEQNTLYVRANNWMVDQFQNADSVVQFADKESGTVSGRYMLGVIATTQSGLQRKSFRDNQAASERWSGAHLCHTGRISIRRRKSLHHLFARSGGVI